MATKNKQNASERLYDRAAKTLQALPQFCKDLLYNTKVEILIGATVIGSLIGTLGYEKEAKKGGNIPLAFSEIEETMRQLEYKNIDVKTAYPLTYFYSIVNDTKMKVFEANNESYKRNAILRTYHRSFAHELEFKMEQTYRFHAQIPEYTQNFNIVADRALQSLDKLVQAEKDLPPLMEALDQAWDDQHDDVYRTEVYTVTVSDGDGGTRTETHTRQVYDHTVHTYDFDPAQAKASAALLQNFIQKYPNLEITEKLIAVTKTGAENEYAMEKSMRREFDNKIPTPEQALEKANVWRTGSTLYQNLPTIYNQHSRLKETAPKWAKDYKTGKDARYTTYSSRDAGPKEFQTAEAALEYAVHIFKHSNNITDGIENARQSMPLLEQKIRTYIGVRLDGKPGDAKKLRREIMRIARQDYDANFSGGFDTRPVKWGMMVLWAVIGIAVGAGVGAGVDVLIDRNRREPWRSTPKQTSLRDIVLHRRDMKKPFNKR